MVLTPLTTLLENLVGKLEALETFSMESIEGVFKGICEEKGIKLDPGALPK